MTPAHCDRALPQLTGAMHRHGARPQCTDTIHGHRATHTCTTPPRFDNPHASMQYDNERWRSTATVYCHNTPQPCNANALSIHCQWTATMRCNNELCQCTATKHCDRPLCHNAATTHCHNASPQCTATTRRDGAHRQRTETDCDRALRPCTATMHGVDVLPPCAATNALRHRNTSTHGLSALRQSTTTSHCGNPRQRIAAALPHSNATMLCHVAWRQCAATMTAPQWTATMHGHRELQPCTATMHGHNALPQHTATMHTNNARQRCAAIVSRFNARPPCAAQACSATMRDDSP